MDCPHCHHVLETEANTCPVCGEPLDDRAEHPNQVDGQPVDAQPAAVDARDSHGVQVAQGSSGGSQQINIYPPTAQPAGPAGDPKPAPYSRRGRILVAVIVATLLVAVVGVFLVFRGQESQAIVIQPEGTVGDNPFKDGVHGDQPGVTPPPRWTGGRVSADTEALYGGTGNNASCDARAIAAFLQAHSDKAAAWAGVQNIASQDIPRYLAGLTPVILRADTAVTNHGFRAGRATTFPAVLQSGTAVLVDDRGVPRARCSCGNPLTPPATLSHPRYRGTAWHGFDPARVARPQPSSKRISWFAIYDLTDKRMFWRMAGSHGDHDRRADPATATLDGDWTVTYTLTDCANLASCGPTRTETVRFVDCTATRCATQSEHPRQYALTSGTWSTSFTDPRGFYCKNPRGTTYNSATATVHLTVTSTETVDDAVRARTLTGTLDLDARSNPPTCPDNPHTRYRVSAIRSASTSSPAPSTGSTPTQGSTPAGSAEPSPSPTPTPPSATPPNPSPEPKRIHVRIESTSQDWTPAGVSFSPGERVDITSLTGTWSVDHRNFEFVGPDGYTPATDATIYQGCKINSTLPYAILLARTGSGPPWPAGSPATFDIAHGGPLQFHINDTCLADNAGAIDITLVVNP